MNRFVNYFLPLLSVLEDEKKTIKILQRRGSPALPTQGSLATETSACIPENTGAKKGLCCTLNRCAAEDASSFHILLVLEDF